MATTQPGRTHTATSQDAHAGGFLSAQEVRERYGIDLITAEVLRHGLFQLTQQMVRQMTRTSTAPIMRDYRDCTFQVHQVTEAGVENVATSEGCLQQAFGGQNAANLMLDEYKADNLRPGDVIFMNDAYRGAIHTSDVNLLRPVFYQGKMVYLMHDVTHLTDMGGPVPCGFAVAATNVWEEPPRLGPTLLYADDVPVRSTWNFLLEDTRTPDHIHGDLLALYGALVTGERLLLKMIERYGLDVVRAAGLYALDWAERRMRTGLLRIPDGKYTASDFNDDDGFAPQPVEFTATIIKKGDAAEIDFSGTQRQPVGASKTAWVDAARCIAAVKFYADPESPWNGGAQRPFHVLLPPGSAVCALPPASVSSHMDTGCRVVNVLTQALAKAVPERAMACDCGTIGAWFAHGVDGRADRAGTPFAALLIPGGAWGATAEVDGCTGTMAALGNVLLPIVEFLERENPFIIWELNLTMDSAGAGEHRGGLGGYITFEALQEMTATVCFDRSRTGAPGVNGGGTGMPSFAVRLKKQGNGTPPTISGITPAQHLVPMFGIFDADGRPNPIEGRFGLGCESQLTKFTLKLAKGDIVRSYIGGGGGWGDPLCRPVEKVLRDVRGQLTSMGFARAAYGVVIDPASIEVDEPATRALRHELASKRARGEWRVPIAHYPDWPRTNGDMSIFRSL
ncbi:MAG: hydantoinase B/oxoprolinase family protein [Candidatus Binataceae bacterium]|jgi:N-methylhydantoinase B